ncbi:MAG: AAA family ATPase [Verrucomicrobiota bacterium JB023]|nr:AAA family ATPase [Verrucomicrobiota bacterium JB023]
MPSASHDRLKTLDSITDFGLFKNFTWDATQLDDFSRYNLIYGWNYSGKTTLSRVFQCIEDSAIHKDFTGGRFHFSRGDGTAIDSTFAGSLPHIRVFNRHFVQRNFRDGTDMTGANVIAVLGEANQALKDRLADLEARLTKVNGFRTRLRDSKQAVQDQINADGTAQARVVNGIIGGPFDRRHLQTTVNALPSDSWPLPLNNTDLEAKKEEFRRATDFSPVAAFTPNHSPAFRSVFLLRQALREVATNTAIESLRTNHKLETWVQSGINLNAADSACGFCGNTVSKARWTELQEHFSEAFSALQTKIKTHKTTIEGLNFDAPTTAEDVLFPDLRARFQTATATLQAALQRGKNVADSLVAKLDAKLAALETCTEWRPNLIPAKELRSAIFEYNAIITEHNERVAAAETVKADARSAICTHFAVEYLRDSSVIKKSEQMDNFDKRAEDCSRISSVVGSKIGVAKQAIKDASIAARRINDNLNVLLPGDNIEVVKLNDTDFEFQRGGQIAKNMSEGERTAVAFAYFLTKLEEGTIPLQETIIVVDDPISSLDSNHIYAVHSITENRLAKARQLFVLTHNSSFFGMTKDWMKKLNGRFFMTHRELDAAQEWFTSLVKLPKLLKKFKSDYQYTYYCLKLIDDDPAPQFENLCGVPNMIRRLLEAYLGFVFPEAGGWGDKLPKVIPCEETCGKIKKFADENSHSHSLTQATEVPNYVSHCKEVINDVLSAIRTHNPNHVASLEAEFAAEAGNLP